MATLRTPDGIDLALSGPAWPEPGVPPRGTVLVVHGLGEHIGRQAVVMQRLRREGWVVAGYDQRGHGQSGGPRGGQPRSDSLLADLGQVLAHLRPQLPGPWLLLGHSLGGLLCGRHVAEGLAAQPAAWWQPVQGLVMSSPALDAGLGAAQRLLLALMERLAPDLAVHNGLKPAWISRDPAVVRAYVDDPRVHNRITARLARFIVDAGQRVRTEAPRWAVPTLLLYAGADRCVSPAGSQAFAAAAPGAVVTTQRFDGLAHEIFNEPEREQVLQALTDWLHRQPWPAPTGSNRNP